MEEKRKILTLVVVRKEGRVLLGMKKRGFGAGRFNGFGGKVEAGETIEAAATRELFEESGLQADSLGQVGLLDFRFLDKSGEVLEVHVFSTSDYSGEPAESEEMKPEWFDEKQIPFEKMWPDDSYWFPLLLAGKKFKGSILFGEKDSILENDIHEVEEL